MRVKYSKISRIEISFGRNEEVCKTSVARMDELIKNGYQLKEVTHDGQLIISTLVFIKEESSDGRI